MEENYIQIFTTFLAGLLEKEKIALEDVVGLVKVFEPISSYVKNREQLSYFLSKYVDKYPQLKELQNQLADPNYKFN